MNTVELNAILYYADYLSLKAISQPVTDNCKYFFIHGCPINSAFILNLQPIYDIENKYFIQACEEYGQIKDQFYEDGVMSFINDICFIRSCGMVDAERMLQNIHLFATNQERKQAFKEYRQWKNQLKYTYKGIDERGNAKERECTKFFKHAEEASAKPRLYKSTE